jgi:hypothetical protein
MPHSSDCLQLNPASPPSCLADVRGLRRIGSRWALGCVLLFVLVGPPLARATDVPGGNASGTWTAAGSPYNVLGDITVPAGQDLTLEPGVTVAFQGDYRLTVAGTMHAIGTEADSIRITGSTDWQRIRLENVSEPSAFAYCVISRADRGVHSVDAQVDIAHCRLYGHTTAIEVYGIGDATPPAVNVTACRIHDCQQHGVFVVENSATTIADCEITRCALDGSARGAIQLSNQTTAGSNDPTIAGNWIHHNTWQGITAFDVTGGGRIHPHILANLVEYNYTGVYLLYASGELRDNIVRMNFQGTNPNSGAGIMLYGAATHPVLTGNELTGNFTGLYVVQGATGNLGDLSNVDPSDDGHNHIHANVDPGGNTWSIYSNSTADIMAENNVWDSTDYAEIALTIYDGNDFASYGIVDFDPILDAAAVPTMPPAPAVHVLGAAPNPFTDAVALTMQVDCDQASDDSALEIFDASGRCVWRLGRGPLSPGRHAWSWDGTTAGGARAPAGTYYWRLRSGPVSGSGRILRVR